MSDNREVSNEKVERIDAKRLGEILSKNVDKIRTILPQAHRHQAERFIARACLTFAGAEPKVRVKLEQCTPASLVTSVLEGAECGFAIDGHFAYWIPYGRIAQCQFDYKALIQRAKRAGAILDARAQIVHENDEFDWRDRNGEQTYEFKKVRDRGEIVGAYSVITLPSRIYRFEHMDIDELEKIHRLSKSPGSPAWVNFKDRMYCKIVLKRPMQQMLDDPGLIRMIEIDNKEFDMDRIVEGRVVSKGNKSGTLDDLADSMESAPAITHQNEPIDFSNPSSMTPEEQAEVEAAYAEAGGDSDSDLRFGG